VVRSTRATGFLGFCFIVNYDVYNLKIQFGGSCSTNLRNVKREGTMRSVQLQNNVQYENHIYSWLMTEIEKKTVSQLTVTGSF